MYKTQYSLEVHITGVDDSTQLEDSAALHQIKSCQNIDVPGLIIPYHAVEYVVVTTTRTETADPVDDNCIGGGDDPAEPGTLKIVNNGDRPIEFIGVAISEALDGTYGDLTFSTDGGPLPDGYQAYAQAMNLAPGATLTATGLPDGANVMVATSAGHYTTGTVPCTFTLDDQFGSLVISNISGETQSVEVVIGAEIEGQYGDLTFAVSPDSTPEEPASIATFSNLANNATIIASGLPMGAPVTVRSGPVTENGYIPYEMTLEGK